MYMTGVHIYASEMTEANDIISHDVCRDAEKLSYIPFVKNLGDLREWS